MIFLLAFLLFASQAQAALIDATIAGFPSNPAVGTSRIAVDGVTEADCSTGGGGLAVLCTWNGATWEPGGGGGGLSIGAGTDVPATCTPVTGPNALFLDTDDEDFYVCIATNVLINVHDVELDTIQTVFGRGNIITSAVSFATALKLLDVNGDGFAWYVDPTKGPIFVCVDNFVENACASYTRELGAGQTLVYKNSSGTDIFVLTESTGAISGAKISYTNNDLTIEIDKRADVAACQGGVAQAVWNLPASNAPAPTCEGSNTTMATLDFDASTDESYSGVMFLPPGGNVTIVWHFRWKAAAATGSTGWCVQMVRVPLGATSDPALPAKSASNCVASNAQGTTLQENIATITNPTCTSCVGGDRINYVVSRDATGSAVTDSMTGDAKLIMSGPVFSVTQ